MTSPSLADLEELAKKAGAILRGAYQKEHQVDYKGVIDLVTEVDRESEAFILGEIQNRFPEHQILAEESGGSLGIEHQWYVDPLDGTVNYAHHIPIFCVSIAYAAKKGVSLAAVYDPMRDELFSAAQNQGAHLNGRRLHVSNASELQRSLLVTGFPYDAWNTKFDNFDNFIRFSKLTQGVRRLGSAALELCYVAAGRFDGLWELGLSPWDVAAGGLICTEAGGQVTNINGSEDYLTPPQSILATTPGIHTKMQGILSENNARY
jgi:myo-inositol-1(or 4)-monophosphatase